MSTTFSSHLGLYSSFLEKYIYVLCLGYNYFNQSTKQPTMAITTIFVAEKNSSSEFVVVEFSYSFLK